MYDQTHENNNEHARKSQEGRRRKTKEEGRRTKKQEEGRRGLWNISMWESGGCLDILGLSFVKPECLVSLSSNPETCLVSPLPNPETCLVSFLPNPDMLGLSFVKASAWSLFCQTQRRVGLSFVNTETRLLWVPEKRFNFGHMHLHTDCGSTSATMIKRVMNPSTWLPLRHWHTPETSTS